MSETRTAGLVTNETAPEGQITAFHRYGARLFLGATQPFGGVDRIGSTQAVALDRARYRAEEGELVTIVASGVEEETPGHGAVAVHIDTPVPSTPRLPNTYIQEMFGIGLIPSRGYEHSVRVAEYTPDGVYVPGVRALEAVLEDYPELLKKFQPGSRYEHFIEQLLTVAHLSFADEVGCEPNPYCREL